MQSDEVDIQSIGAIGQSKMQNIHRIIMVVHVLQKIIMKLPANCSEL